MLTYMGGVHNIDSESMIRNRKKFIRAVAEKLKAAYEQSDLVSYRELSERAAELGYAFSGELLSRYFAGNIEPGIYTFCAFLRCLNLSANEVLFNDLDEYLDAERANFIKRICAKLKREMELFGLREADELAIFAKNAEYPVEAANLYRIMEGNREPTLYEFVAILAALKSSADKILYGKDPLIMAGSVSEHMASNLTGLLQIKHLEHVSLVAKYECAPHELQVAIDKLLFDVQISPEYEEQIAKAKAEAEREAEAEKEFMPAEEKRLEPKPETEPEPEPEAKPKPRRMKRARRRKKKK
jgi:hypothetical protein